MNRRDAMKSLIMSLEVMSTRKKVCLLVYIRLLLFFRKRLHVDIPEAIFPMLNAATNPGQPYFWLLLLTLAYVGMTLLAVFA